MQSPRYDSPPCGEVHCAPPELCVLNGGANQQGLCLREAYSGCGMHAMSFVNYDTDGLVGVLPDWQVHMMSPHPRVLTRKTSSGPLRQKQNVPLELPF